MLLGFFNSLEKEFRAAVNIIRLFSAGRSISLSLNFMCVNRQLLYNSTMINIWDAIFNTTNQHVVMSYHHNCPYTLQWRHGGRNGVSNHQPHDCLHNRLFRRRSKKTSKFCIAGLYVGNSPVTGEFPAQRTSNAENVSIWRRHHTRGSFWTKRTLHTS